MDWLIFLIASGAIYFVGIGAILLGIAGFAFGRREWVIVLSTLIAVVGWVFIAFSATPAPYSFYAGAGAASFFWLVAERSRRPWLQNRRRIFRWFVAAIWIIAAMVELPYHFAPMVPPIGRPKLYILGDSITAGISTRDETWPRVLARTRSIEVADLSHVGAFVDSGLKMANSLPSEGGLVLVELGGNDLLGGPSAKEFEHGLDQLLARVCIAGRTVLMFELPLPPFHNEFGRIQRQLASRYGVLLIPKRVLMSLLTGNGITVDGIHLTQAGHERMAAVVWDIIRPAYGE